MGRQTQLHMLPSDVRLLLDCIQERTPVVATLRSSDSAIVTPLADPTAESQVMTLWNRALLVSLERKLVVRPGGKDYYRVDDSLPTLELSPSRLIEWNGRPALLQGRIYGLFDVPLSGYEAWYEVVTRCVRAAKFTKNPFKLLGGYIGPEAFKWFQDGGVLLPMLEPPPTLEWMTFAKNQHAAMDSPAE